MLTDEQRLAVESIDVSVLVAAGAGSGKTHVLVERFLEILSRQEHVSVTDIIAVTYTRKAANEMRSRLKVRMEELVAATSGYPQEKWRRCLSELDAARIGTIHSLCETILKTFPEEAAVDPEFSVLDELEAAQLLAESLEEAIYQASTCDAESQNLLANFPVETIKDAVRSMVKSPIKFAEAAAKLGQMSNDDLSKNFLDMVDGLKSRIVADVLNDRRWHKLINGLKSAAFADETNRLEQMRRQAIALSDQFMGAAKHDANAAFGCLREITNVSGKGTIGGNSPEAKTCALR